MDQAGCFLLQDFLIFVAIPQEVTVNLSVFNITHYTTSQETSNNDCYTTFQLPALVMTHLICILSTTKVPIAGIYLVQVQECYQERGLQSLASCKLPVLASTMLQILLLIGCLMTVIGDRGIFWGLIDGIPVMNLLINQHLSSYICAQLFNMTALFCGALWQLIAYQGEHMYSLLIWKWFWHCGWLFGGV